MKLKKEWVPFFTIIVIILAFGCKKSIPADRCDYDGARIEPLYGVCFSLQDGSEKRFCSIVCASMSFQELKGRIKEVMVVDEVSEKKISVSQAFFIESEVITTLHVKNRIHVFSSREDAERHLKRFNGRWIGNPFRLSPE
jgi:ribosomal protein L24E